MQCVEPVQIHIDLVALGWLVIVVKALHGWYCIDAAQVLQHAVKDILM